MNLLTAYILSLVVIIATLTPVQAEVYSYMDDSGTVHFTNVPTEPQYKMIMPPDEMKKNEMQRKRRKGAISIDLDKLITAKSYRYGLDPALVKAVIAVESNFDPGAVSEKGAMGLMQLMPMTASDLGVMNSFDPEDNVDGGARHLRYLLDYFNWDVDMALAAYHAGKTRVVRHSGIPPIPATLKYIDKVKNTYRGYIFR